MSITSQGEDCIGCGSNGIMTIDDNSPIMVNGQRMNFTLDGMSIGFSQLLSIARAGALAIELRSPTTSRTLQLPVEEMLGRLQIPTSFTIRPGEPKNILTITGYNWFASGDSRGGQPPIDHPDRGRGEDRPKFDCDTFLSNLFGDPGAYFFDDTFWDYDRALNTKRPTSNMATDPRLDSHLYGDEDDLTKSTNIYVPPGFVPVIPNKNFANTTKGLPKHLPRNRYIGREDDSDGTYLQNYTLFYNATLKLTLAIWHVDNYGVGKPQADGRTRIGTIGFSPESGGAIAGGGHAHFDLYFSPRGPRTSLPRSSDRPGIRRSFRIFCP